MISHRLLIQVLSLLVGIKGGLWPAPFPHSIIDKGLIT